MNEIEIIRQNRRAVKASTDVANHDELDPVLNQGL